MAVLPSYLSMVELVEGAAGVSVQGELSGRQSVTMHKTDARWVLVVELTIVDIFWEGHLDLK